MLQLQVYALPRGVKLIAAVDVRAGCHATHRASKLSLPGRSGAAGFHP